MEATTYKRSKTTDFIQKLNFIIYLSGFPGIGPDPINLPEKFMKFYKYLNLVFRILIYLFVIFEWATFFTQDVNSLCSGHRSNLILFSISHPMLIMFRDIMDYKIAQVRELFYNLTVNLKSAYNDPQVEDRMIKSTLLYVSAMSLSCTGSMAMLTFEAVWDMALHNGTFTTVVTAYPEVDDRSLLANVIRIICYIIWIIFCIRVVGTYVLVIPITTCLSYQFSNLRSYFESLNDIFERKDLSQREMEELYELKFIDGIKMHLETLRCRDQIEKVSSGMFSGQIVFNILLIVVLMAQIANAERSLVNLLSAGFTATAILITTGFCMWNSGDVTIEASHLGQSIYFSGWHNCMGQSNVRVRKLVMCTMANAQRPVVLKALGYIDLSYQSYITIVKASYSVFSVLF